MRIVRDRLERPAAAARGDRRRARDRRRGAPRRRPRPVLRLTARFDHAELAPDQIQVDPREVEASLGVLEPEVARPALRDGDRERAGGRRGPAPRPRRGRAARGPARSRSPRCRCGGSGVYVPAGRAAYPSTVVMCAVTARAAGVEEIAVCAPPGPGGSAHPVILAACVLCGVTEVYRMGGAQAIAALAYGTESVQAVDVIAGPGNAYVQEAKRQVVGQVGIDGIAGPSELIVLAAGGRRPRARRARPAGPGRARRRQPARASISHDRELLDAVVAAVERLAPERPSVADAELMVVRADDGRTRAWRWPSGSRRSTCSSWARRRRRWPAQVRAAGCVFVGAGRRHGLRRLRRGLQPRAAHRRRGALPGRALGGHLPAPNGACIVARRGARSPGTRRRRTGTGRGLPGPRRVDGAPRIAGNSRLGRL